MFLPPISIRPFLHFIIYSNLWIASAATLLCLPFYVINQSKPDLLILSFTFTSTLFIYTYQRYAKIKTQQHFSAERQTWMTRHSLFVQGILYTSGLASVVLMLLLELETLKILIPAGILSVFYVGRFLIRKIPGFRDLPFLKAYVVALAWTAMLVFLPLFEAGSLWNSVHLMYAIALFFFVFSLAVIFDLRDVSIDDPAMRTIPQLMGQNGTLTVALISLVAAIFTMMLLKPAWWICLVLIGLTGAILMFSARRRTDDFFYSFWLDGFIFLPGIAALFFWL